MRIWHGRHSAPLLMIWVIALGLAALLYKIADIQPALSELFSPLYIIILGVAAALTWKWFRARAAGRSQDRRHGDRRRLDRRDQ